MHVYMYNLRSWSYTRITPNTLGIVCAISRKEDVEQRHTLPTFMHVSWRHNCDKCQRSGYGGELLSPGAADNTV